MQEKISWTAESHLGKMLHQWWQGLEDDRASRAMLRRCATLDAVALCPAYQRLYRYLIAAHAWPAETHPWQKDKLAAIAGLLAHVKTEGTQRLSLKMSELRGDKPLVSELRFRDLLKVDTTDDLFISLRRVLPLVGHQASAHQLAHDVYWWNDDTKKQWAYSYRWPVK